MPDSPTGPESIPGKPGVEKRRSPVLTSCYPLHLRAMERNRSPHYRIVTAHRRNIAEGAFASLTGLGRSRLRLRVL